MRNKLILFLMLALFGSTSFLRADEVQIGVGGTATNTYLPSYSLYNYSLTQQIYTAEEIGVGACTINSIAFYNSGSEKTRTYTMYLVNTTKETFDSSTDWIVVTAADQVFTGSMTMASGTWNVFTLDTPFEYDGTNLAVIMDDNTGSWSGGLSCYVFDATSQAIRIYSDGTNYDPFAPAGYSGTVLSVKNQLILDVTINTTPVGPVVPTGEFGITPNDVFALNDRPLNGWSEPFSVRIYNGGEPTVIEASLSNTAGDNPYYMMIDGETSMNIASMTIDTDDAFDFDIVVNPNAPAGTYTEEFTLFYAASGRDIITIPVTGNLYTAVAPDIVEVPGEVTWTSDQFTDNPDETNLFANYNLYGMSEMKKDAVYHFTLNNDYKLHAVAGDDFIAVYNAADVAELNASVEPVVMGENGVIDEETLLAGEYYLVVAGDNISNVTMVRAEIPEATEITYINPSPDDGAMDVTAPVTLAWSGGDNATEYQVLFGTVYPPTIPVVDWTMIDDNYGSYTINDLAASTQYFWQIKVRNSHGTVAGEVRGFTTTLTAPHTVTASETEIFTDESTLIKWKFSGASTGFTGEITVADGTTTSSYIPVYGLWMDDYTRCEMIYPAEMLEDMYGGEITSLKYYISSAATGPWSGDVFNVYMMEVDATTLNAFYTSTDAEIVYTGGLDGQGTEMVIDLDNSYTYGGGNLLIGIEEITASTWKSCSFYGIEAAGASGSGYSSASLAAVPFTQRDFLPKTTFTCGGKGYRDVTANRSFQGYNVYMVYGEDNGGSNPPTPPTPPSGDSWSDDFEDGELTNWTVIDADGDGQNWVNATPASYGIGNAHSGTNCASSWSWNSVSYDPDNYMISPMFANATSIQYFVATNTGYPDHYALMASTTGSSTSDFTTVFEETVGSAKDGYHGTKSSMTKPGTRDMSAWFERNVNLPAGTKYVAFRHYNSYDMNYLFVDDVTVNLGSKNRDGELTIIKLNDEMLTTNQFLFEPDPTFYNMPEGGNIHVTAVYDEGESGFDAGNNVLYISGYSTFTGVVTELISGEPVANANVTFVGHDEFNNTVAYNNITTNASGEYTATVKVGEYTGSASADGYEVAVIEGLTNEHLTPAEVNFQIHEIYYPVYRVYAEDMNDVMAMVQWSLHDFTPAGGGGGGGGGGGTGSTFTEDFEGGVIPAGWATIDADGDGSNWVMGSAAMGSGYGHNGSADLVLSKSYDNTLGALNPNNYLVTPQVDLGASSTFRFYACAQDNAWAAEHFGVAISTGSQTNPSDFTMLQEWTMTAKGQGVPAPGRGGDLRTQGNWYEYTVDLSAYAGQQAYLAIRHFNCTDYFYLDVDDVALTNSKGDRSVNYYTLYRKALLTESSAVTDSLLLADNLTDTLYADFSWANVEPGLYQYGVSAVYPMPAEKGNRGGAYIDFETGDFSQFAFNNGGSYPWAVVAPGYNSGYCMKSTNGGVASSSSTISASVEYPTDGTVSFVAQCMGEGTSTIWDKCIFEIDGVQQFCYGANQPGWVEYSYDVEAGSHTFTWTYSKDSSVNPSGDYMQVDNVEFHYEGGGGGNNPITDVTWSNVLPKNMASVAVLTATANTGSVEGATVNLVNTCEFETGYNFNVVFDETGEVIIEDFRKGNYLVSANLDGFISDYLEPVEVSVWNDTLYLTINFTEYFMPVSTMIVSGTGYARWTDVIPAGDVAERYLVNMNNVNQGETTNCYMQLDVDGLTPGATYPAKVAVIYTTGMSPWCETTFVYQPCQNNYPNITDISNVGMDVTVTWDGGTPPTPPTPPTGDIYDFEDSTMQGWTTIDADGDGQTWELGSTAMGTGYGHNGSIDLVLSKSYDNNIGALTPDNYLVSPAKAEYPAISFYACAQDNAWAAEHFGVAVSTTTATASAFTMVQEWTMTAKGQGVPAPGRGGDRTQGNWYEYTVDLSAYAGQEIWVAIRHFNCTDYFYLDVDDITLGEGGVPPTPPTPPTGDVYDFETGMQGWTTIDADGDGQSWDLGSTAMGSGYGHNGSSDLVLSKSYDNNIGALTPDNYLVSPAKAAYTGISFYACAQDNAWAAEHFGVAVSTTTATASAFTMVQEWTMTAKGQGVPAPGRGGDLRTQGNWYEYTVDLSAYAGQEIWVAIRHFNCTDYFYLDVDDITLGEGTKRGGNFAAAGVGFGAASNSPTDDGNWYYYDNGTNEDAIGLTSGGSFYWGVMFPAGQYEGSTVTKVSMYDYSSHTGNILIYQGGSSAPGTLLATEPYSCTGSSDFIEVTLSSPVTIDPAQNLWIVLNNNGGQYVAACSANTGDANGRWISLDGSSWEDVASYGLSYTWMIRAYIENGGGGGTGASAITPNKFNILVDGEVVGATSGTSFTWTCPDYNEHFYEVVWVDADYNISCPDGQWYQISIIGVNENSVNSILYPNPTNGDLHINAAEMVRITIVNTLGQVVYDQAVDCDETIINMARFDAGIYMVSIATKNGTSVKRVVVTK